MLSLNIIYFVILVSTLAVGATAFFANPKRSQNRHFFIFSYSLCLWVLSVLGIIHSSSKETAELYIRLASVVGVIIPTTLFFFFLSIKHPKATQKELLKKSRLQLLLAIPIILICFTDFFLMEVTMSPVSENIAAPKATYGTGFVLYILYFPVLFLRTAQIFFLQIRHFSGIQKAELQYALIGMLSGFPVALLVHFIAVVSGSSDPQKFGPLCIIPMNTVMAYGIATKRVLGITTILRTTIAYILLATYLTVIYLIVWLLMDFLLDDFFENHQLTVQIVATLTCLLSMAPIQRRMFSAANRLITTQTMDVSATMRKASDIFGSITTIKSMLSFYVDLLKQSLGAESVVILMRSGNDYTQQHPHGDGTTPINLSQDSPIVELVSQTRDPVSYDTLTRIRETPAIKSAQIELQQVEASMAVGVFSKSRLDAIVLIGSRIGRRIYDRIEQDSLQTLCNQFAVALENAQMYTEILDSKIRNEIMLDQLVSGVIVASPDRKITLFNHEAQRMTGLTVSGSIDQNIEVLPDPLYMALAAALKKQSGSQTVDASFFQELGEKKNVSIRMGSAYLFGHDGNPMGALLVFTNITELKGLEEQVRRTDQLNSVGTLAAGMAHEIKNPLVTIKTFSQLLPHRYEDEDFRNDFASLVAHEVSRIDGIVNELLSFSKPAKPHLVPMNLQDTIEQTLKLTHEQMAQKSIALRNKCTAAEDEIFGDAKLLSQALVNLNLNAIEAIGDGGTITVGTINCAHRFANGESPEKATKKKCVRLQISDTGQGIHREDMQKIFDPFFTSKSEGTGMGLSVAHGIISEHHGVIEVESEPGRGTTFYVYIPVLEEGTAE